MAKKSNVREKPILVDYFGRKSATILKIEQEEAAYRERRWAEKVAASKKTGTPPERITIITQWQVY